MSLNLSLTNSDCIIKNSKIVSTQNFDVLENRSTDYSGLLLSVNGGSPVFVNVLFVNVGSWFAAI